jgi:pyruvate/2-oxoglutarate dehydrogenase complex dihydrolipoamide acyltransferase (E2) component
MTPVLLPDLGTRDEPVRISTWLVDPGETVEAGDRIVELLVQGITFDVAAPQSGVLMRIDKAFDVTVGPGDVLGWIDEEHRP